MAIFAPRLPKAKMWVEGMPVDQLDYEEIFYDPYTMSYKTASSEKKIRDLSAALEEKEKQKESSVKSIIAHFYSRR